MKKAIFGIGTVALAVAGVFAVKATGKFANQPAYVGTPANCQAVNTTPQAIFSENGVTQAQLISSGGSAHDVWINSGCTDEAYFKP